MHPLIKPRMFVWPIHSVFTGCDRCCVSPLPFKPGPLASVNRLTSRATAEAIVELDAVSPAMTSGQRIKAAAVTALMALLD